MPAITLTLTPGAGSPPAATTNAADPGPRDDGTARRIGARLTGGSINGDGRVIMRTGPNGGSVSLDDIALRRPTLDDVFLAKTGRSLEGSDDAETAAV